MSLTVKDARLEFRGLGGSLIRYKGGPDAKVFNQVAESLGRQIAQDNSVPFETGEVSDETPLSNLATQQVRHLQKIKRRVLACSV